MAGVTMFMLSLPLPRLRKMCPSSTRLEREVVVQGQGGKETVVRQRLPSPAAGQPVEVLGVCHLEGLPQVPLALPVLRREEGLHGWVVVEGSNQEID